MTFGLSLNEHDGKTVLKSIHVTINDDTVDVSVTPDRKVVAFAVNGSPVLSPQDIRNLQIDDTHLIPRFFTVADEEVTLQQLRRAPSGGIIPAVREIKKFYRSRLHGNFSDEKINDLVRSIRYTSRSNFLSMMSNANTSYDSWNELVLSLQQSFGELESEYLRSLYLLYGIGDYLTLLEQRLHAVLVQAGYIGPSRATGERYYRIQELALDRIDSKGENLAMFLNSLDHYQRERFETWAERHLGYAVRTRREGGHVSVVLREVGSQQEYNLADVGYGLSQVLPVMVQIWAQTSPRPLSSPLLRSPIVKLLAIEQPELHLHPAYQAKIADALVQTANIVRKLSHRPNASRLAIIAETHSQAIINRLGEIISKKEISPSDVAVYVFEKSAETEQTAVSRARFDDDGILLDWPYGFFLSSQKS
jgi:predicted ATP-dependent endonuclease of OLD family